MKVYIVVIHYTGESSEISGVYKSSVAAEVRRVELLKIHGASNYIDIEKWEVA